MEPLACYQASEGAAVVSLALDARLSRCSVARPDRNEEVNSSTALHIDVARHSSPFVSTRKHLSENSET